MPNLVVDDGGVELLRCGELVLGGGQPGLALLLGLGAPAHEPSDQLLPAGGREEDEEGVGHGLADLAGALEVDLEQGHPPGGQRLLDGPARRAVTGHAVHDGRLEQLPCLHHPLEIGVVDEAVVHTIGLARARCSGGHRDREPHLREVVADVGGDGALADGGRPGEDDEAVRAAHAWSKRDSRAEIWFWPSPRTRLLSEMPTSCMIWRARTRPTPGSDSSSAETFILPTML